MAGDVIIRDAKWRKLKRLIERAGTAHVKVGVLQSSGGSEETDDGISMVALAAIHEFGSPAAHIPARSFIRSTFRIAERELNTMTAQLVKALLADKLTIRQALEALGQWGSARVRRTVTEGFGILPIKPATAAKKGSVRPLVDTGRMIQSVGHEVVGN